MVKTAIVILNWNGIDFLRRFLPGVVKNSSLPDTYIYIADNGSNDGSVEMVAENFSQVRIIRLDSNNGFAGGYNLALGQIEATYFVLLNSDIEVSAGWLQPLVSFMDDNPDVASCQPKILSWSQRDYFEHAGAAGGFIDHLGYPLCRGRVFAIVEKDNGQYDDQAEIFWSTGACMVVRSEAWKKCGGFDPDFFAHMEEIDLCWRFHNAGYRVAYVPGPPVYHVGGGALPYNSPLKTFLNFRNSLFMLYKNLPDRQFRFKMFSRKVLDGAAAFSFLAKGQFKSFAAVWRAHMDYYRKMSILRDKRSHVSRPAGIDFSNIILNKTIVTEFYLKGRKSFTLLNQK